MVVYFATLSAVVAVTCGDQYESDTVLAIITVGIFTFVANIWLANKIQALE